MNRKTYLKEKQVAELTQFSLQTLRNNRFLRRGIPYLKCGRSVRYDWEDVLSFMESKKVNTKDI